MQYSYTFSDELRQEWHWTERYASQPEILRYLNYVADKFDLRKDIQFETRIETAVFDETLSCWNIQTDSGNHLSAKFIIMATGCLSKAKIPDIKGLDIFNGKIYHTGQWPHEVINFNDRRVAIMGTGSSGIQCIPMIAEQAAHVHVFQRTPSFSIPAHNAPLDAKDEQSWKVDFDEHQRKMLETFFGVEGVGIINDESAVSVTPEERQQVYEARWQIGGLTFVYAFNDLLLNRESNDTAAAFVRSKIRATVKDPAIAEILTPHDYHLGCKRLCVDSHYFDTYNRDNVTLVDLQKENIEEITSVGIKTKNTTYKVDDIVFATGFDAMTWALNNIDIHGRSDGTLREKWVQGPRTYLGIMTAGFPNLFIITGPGSPSVLTNMIVSIETQVEWLAKCLDYLRKHHFDSIEATVEAEDAWVNHVNKVANMSLFPTAKSWYVGANIPGKPRVFMPYAGGLPAYLQKCENVATAGYEGFHLKKYCSTPSVATQ
jgi:cyclohexanone monooxygenase